MTTYVWVTTQFVGFHRWKDAPEEVKFLRDYHRHIFHVKLAVQVTHNNRQVEFFTLKKELDTFLELYKDQYFEESCEMIAQTLLKRFGARIVNVSEDNENGATVTSFGDAP